MTKKILLFVLTIFGLVTVFMSSSVLFDWFGIREKEGNYVPFVVIANFICGFLYLIAAFGIFKDKKWSPYLLILAFIILIITFIALYFHISSGGIYETKTVKALAFRTVLTLIFTITNFKIFKK
ncbi:MAG: hypothetical protein IAE62_05030 [Flavobacteriales bacterium]|nr:hypothetical protein [Flavobacteriales bacterium]